MRLLLDTHVVLWQLSGERELSQSAVAAIADASVATPATPATPGAAPLPAEDEAPALPEVTITAAERRAALDRFFARALAKDRADRFATMDELVREGDLAFGSVSTGRLISWAWVFPLLAPFGVAAIIASAARPSICIEVLALRVSAWSLALAPTSGRLASTKSRSLIGKEPK